MTWKEFKLWAEQHGVKDEDVISFIDFQSQPFLDEIRRNKWNEIEIR